MKKYFVLPVILLFIISCKNHGKKNNAGNDSLHNAQASQLPKKLLSAHDTIYRFGDLMVECPAGVDLHYFDREKHESIPAVSRSWDKIYSDKTKTLFSGLHIPSMRVYKKMTCRIDFSAYKTTVSHKPPHAFTCALFTAQHVRIVTQDSSEFHKEGMNFAGHYAILQQPRTGKYTSIVVIDLQTGECYSGFPFDQEKGAYGFEYHANSNLLVVNSALMNDFPGYRLIEGDLQPELYKWDGSRFAKVD